MLSQHTNYYPVYDLGCAPIHAVTDWCKVRKLVRDARRGDQIKPLLIEVQPGNCTLLAGTHQAAANDLLTLLGGEALIDCVSTDDIDISDDLQIAIDNNDYETINWIWDQAPLSLRIKS